MSEKKPKKKPKGIFRLFWYYLKEDEGPIGWILNILVAFVVIKYLLIPGAGFLLGTPHPLVAVVSGSMEHRSDFDNWWNVQCVLGNGDKQVQHEIYASHKITNKEFQKFRFANGLNTGDLMLLKSAKNVAIGDVIVFNGNTKVDPIIHRVVAVTKNDQNFYTTKGDNNCGISNFEKSIPEFRVLGKAWARIPYLGYVKLYFEKILRAIGFESVLAVFR